MPNPLGVQSFGVLALTNCLIAGKLVGDTGPACNLAFTEEELNKPVNVKE